MLILTIIHSAKVVLISISGIVIGLCLLFLKLFIALWCLCPCTVDANRVKIFFDDQGLITGSAKQFAPTSGRRILFRSVLCKEKRWQ